tara:strand:+ start:1499 stop:2005 length:507 start_codon:yes stop_codon:yes gene_type:complete
MDAQKVEALLRNRDEEALVPHLVSYMKHTDQIQANLLIDLAMGSSTPYTVSEVIKSLSYRNHNSEPYRKLVLLGMKWPHDDWLNDVLLASLNRMPRYLSPTREVRNLLKALESHPSAILRDALAEVVQEYCGISDAEIVRSNGDGNLFQHINPRFREWLSETQHPGGE